MAQLTINTGTIANDGTGDTIRAAMVKVNTNFTEVYDAVASIPTDVSELTDTTGLIASDLSDLTDTTGLLGNIDLSAIAQSIVPSADVTYDIGSITNRFRDLYLSGSTLYLGDAVISANIDGSISIPGIQVGNGDVASTLVLQGAVNSVQTSLDSVSSQLASTQSQIDSLQSQYASLQSQILIFQSIIDSGPSNPQYATAVSQIGSLQSQLSSLGSQINTLNSLVDTYQITSDELTSKLNNPSADVSYNIDDSSIELNNNGTVWKFTAGGNTVYPDATVQTTAWTGVGDLTGSVFADDNTLLVDAVNGAISWNVITDRPFIPSIGETIYDLDGVNLTLEITDPTLITLLIAAPIVGYAGSDTHTVTLAAGVAGQRLVVINNSTLCTLAFDLGGPPVNVAPSTVAEFIYTSTDGWYGMYGVS